MKITFCGAARTVTGSCHLLQLSNGVKILLDCGLYQGYDFDLLNFNKTWKFKPEEIDYLILSHAHIDHSGRIPKLVKDGFKGRIVCTFATRDLATIMLMDSAHIQEKDAEWTNRKNKERKRNEKKVQPLYTREDVEASLNLFIGIGYGEWYTLPDGTKLLFRDSGHILGSASVNLRIKQNDKNISLAFTGDIGRPSRPILKDPEPMPQADYIICESTYGGKTHPSPPEEQQGLLDIIKKTCVEKKGKLIIPAFSVGRTQELVYMMDKMSLEGLLPEIPVFVDSPLAINATEIFKAHPECYDRNLSDYLMLDPNPFGFNRLQYVRSAENSKKLNSMKKPCIIISASGMITAGRILHHISNGIEHAENTILIVGYCAEGSIGAQLAKGAKEIKVFGEQKKVKAEITMMHSFSAHGDQGEMINYLSNQDKKKVKKIFLVHGDYERQVRFRDALMAEGFRDIEIPDIGNSYNIEN